MAIILFTLFYAGVTMGVDLNLHYCGGKLAKVTIVLPSPSCCCDESKSNADCCADAQLSIQMDVDQVHMSAPDFESTNLVGQCFAAFKTPALTINNSKDVPQILPIPPPLRAQELRILMGSLTYYG